MNRSVYLEAARMVAQGEENAACLAISRITKDYPPEEFVSLFRPESEREGRGFDGCCWLATNAEMKQAGDRHPDSRNRRVVALCFMAAMSATK